jgi:hypothetical protein
MRLRDTLVIVAAFLLAGCSSTPARVDRGPIRAGTFSFVDRGPRPQPDFAEKRQQVHAAIQSAISGNLGGRGLQAVPSGGDLTVAYLVIVGNNVATAAIDDYFGYARDTAAVQAKAHAAATSSKNPNYFAAGTLVIDLLDAKSYQLLKRGYATRPLLRDAADDARAARIQEVVDEILRDLRIAQ